MAHELIAIDLSLITIQPVSAPRNLGAIPSTASTMPRFPKLTINICALRGIRAKATIPWLIKEPNRSSANLAHPVGPPQISNADSVFQARL